MITDIQQQKSRLSLPFKSVAGALLFSVILGPLGLLYASVLGGTVMMILSAVSIGHKLWGIILVLWLASCVWSVVAVNRYNKKILNSVVGSS